MGRLPGFDYKRPFFYMVTLKRAARVLQGDVSAPPFSAISEEGRVEPNAVTEAFEAEIAGWARFWRSVESVSPHVVMPDHLHLLVKLAAVEKAVSLPVVVGDLRKRLNRAYGRVLQGGASAPPAGAAGAATGKTTAPTILDPEWHDWIVKKEGHRRPPVLQSPAPAGATGAALLAVAARIGPGGAGLSTFLSPLEKAAGNEIAKAGGSLIVLSMQGFGERWHPGAKQERLCAEGRMLYLSPYPPQAAKLTKQEMHLRAHALVDWALAHSNEQLEAWPDVPQGAAPAAQVLQGAAPAAQVLQGAAPAAQVLQGAAPAAPTFPAADAPVCPTTSCAATK